MDKLIPILIVTGIILLGFIMKLIELNDVIKRINFTNRYHDKFISIINELVSNKRFNQQLYYELTLNVKAMQYELGADGVYAYITDPLKGFSTRNYQALINFLPELKDVLNNQDIEIMINRFNESAKNCDDMFIRHLGTLNELEKSLRKKLFNPFSGFSYGIRFIVSLPILLLNWIGIISDENTRKAKHNLFIKFLNFIIVLIGLIGSVLSIVLGWSEFWQKMSKLF